MIEQYRRDIVKAKKILRKILVIIIVVLLIFIVAKIVKDISGVVLFPVKSVQIFGNKYVSSKDIMKIIGIGPSVSLLTLKSEKAEMLLMSDNRIESAVVVKVFPDTLKIYLKEKRAEFTLDYNGKRYVISNDGTILGKAVSNSDVFRPILLIENNDDINIGSKVNNFLLLEVIGVLSKMEEMDKTLLNRLTSVNVRTSGIYLELDKGKYRVYMGSYISMGLIDKLKALLKVLNNNSLDDNNYYIDLNNSYAVVKVGE